jgi:hypothetical protein
MGMSIGAEAYASRVTRRLLVLVCLAAAAAAGPAAAADELRVVVVPTLELADLERLSQRGAVGLLVPGAGPETSGELARAALLRGEVRNSLRGGLPSGPALIRVETAARIPRGRAIVLALPQGRRQPNDRRYSVAVLAPGYRGLLVSDSTRLPGLVSIVDVAPTALAREGALRSAAAADPLRELRTLDRRIDRNGDVRPVAGSVGAALIAALALVAPVGAPLAAIALLAANLVLGAAGASSFGVVLALLLGSAVAAAVLTRWLHDRLWLGLAAVGVLAAYLVAMGVEAASVALSPLGPTQNARFYGLSNLLATMLLVPALAGAWALARRFGAPALVAVAALALVTVAGSRFGADGGGAVVLAVGYAVLAAGLLGRSNARTAVLAGAAVAAAVGALLALDAALGLSTHVSRSLRGGPESVASDLGNRVVLSWERATSGWGVGLAVAGGILVLAALVARLPRLRLERAAKVLLTAFAAAIAASLVVNDSPLEVAIWGAVGYLALERWAAGEATTPQVELGSTLQKELTAP